MSSDFSPFSASFLEPSETDKEIALLRTLIIGSVKQNDVDQLKALFDKLMKSVKQTDPLVYRQQISQIFEKALYTAVTNAHAATVSFIVEYPKRSEIEGETKIEVVSECVKLLLKRAHRNYAPVDLEETHKFFDIITGNSHGSIKHNGHHVHDIVDIGDGALMNKYLQCVTEPKEAVISILGIIHAGCKYDDDIPNATSLLDALNDFCKEPLPLDSIDSSSSVNFLKCLKSLKDFETIRRSEQFAKYMKRLLLTERTHLSFREQLQDTFFSLCDKELLNSEAFLPCLNELIKKSYADWRNWDIADKLINKGMSFNDSFIDEVCDGIEKDDRKIGLVELIETLADIASKDQLGKILDATCDTLRFRYYIKHNPLAKIVVLLTNKGIEPNEKYTNIVDVIAGPSRHDHYKTGFEVNIVPDL